MMPTIVGNLVEVGSRLRSERERLAMNQDDFGLAGGVTRNSQSAYEAGRRAFDALYLSALPSIGVDVGYVMTGDRTPAARPAELELVTMRVALPPRSALVEMFAAVLEIYPDLHGAELAHALARHLPTGLGQLTDLLPVADDRQPLRPAASGDHATDRAAPRRATRT